jgi:hypothetical protein
MVNMANPGLIVCVGTWAKAAAKDRSGWLLASFCQIVEIVHPAAILRANVAQRGLMVQRCKVIIAKACDQLPPF